MKSCLPDDYTEVLHLCSDNDGICRGILRLTVIPFVRFISSILLCRKPLLRMHQIYKRNA